MTQLNSNNYRIVKIEGTTTVWQTFGLGAVDVPFVMYWVERYIPQFKKFVSLYCIRTTPNPFIADANNIWTNPINNIVEGINKGYLRDEIKNKKISICPIYY